MISWIYLVLAACVALWAYRKWEAGHFARRGLKSVPYTIPFLGNVDWMVLQKEHITQVVARIYRAFPNEKYVGFKQLEKNMVMIRDIEMLKGIGIKDFDHFPEHHIIAISEEVDDLFGKTLLALKGERWRDMRATLSPAFTSSKMRNIFQFVVEIGEQMRDYHVGLLKSQEFKERGLIEIEMKEAITRYANDVIASAAMGIKINSFSDRENIFYRMGKHVGGFEGIRQLYFFMSTAFPRFTKLWGIQLLAQTAKDFFRKVVLDAMKEREQKGIVRPDMIHLLMEARKGSLKHDAESSAENGQDVGFAAVQESQVGRKAVQRDWADDDVVAQVLIFYAAGYESVSTAMSFMAHELTVNPDVQKKLQDEIDGIVLNEDGHLNYNDLIRMPYMDMVVSETLRKWPPISINDRKCLKPYVLPPSSKGAKEYLINKGESVLIPTCAYHYDPKFFPNPEVFDPERFSEENKKNIRPFSYLPFGLGPRNCIGSRFALMEMKAVMFYMLKRFDFVKTAKTQDPIRLQTNNFNLRPEKGFWIGLKSRY